MRVVLEPKGSRVEHHLAADEVMGASPTIVTGAGWHFRQCGPVRDHGYRARRHPPPLENVHEVFGDGYYPCAAPSDEAFHSISEPGDHGPGKTSQSASRGGSNRIAID